VDTEVVVGDLGILDLVAEQFHLVRVEIYHL
jgi:hypothetical protein